MSAKHKAMGVIGLGVMGQNLALNIERNGYSVAGYDVDVEKAGAARDRFAGGDMVVVGTLEELLDRLERPRRIMMMVPAGKPVDSLIDDLRPGLSSGDLLIDGGNSHFEDTRRRLEALAGTGILYVGTGVSGGEEGALRGPSIMPGGNPDAWPLVKSIFQKIAAKAPDGVPCCDWIGPDGAGHFVKMIHNGIEYGDMQMICEAYYLMERVLGLTPADMQGIFERWNEGDLNSYLIEITGTIMAKTDPDTGKPLVHVILDTAQQKGTGKWASVVSLDLGVPAQTIAIAVFSRMMSALKAERVAAAQVLHGPEIVYSGDPQTFIEMIRQALYASKICSYAQGFQLLRAANEEYGWNLQFGAIAALWRAGCIIRARFLSRIKDAYDGNPTLANLLLDPYFSGAIREASAGWRSVVATAAELGVPVPAFSSALAYYDSYRSAVLPANLLQAQRDFFGAHTYRRVDRDGVFHTNWED
ncbi:MAG: NADP-dependent phosphogluconate dehydrogenase [Gemmatimonadota bacterium]|nr:MAG: NADP-dependent phosphogluconate dehydrogenase [Gemmatimonadota bacterium]